MVRLRQWSSWLGHQLARIDSITALLLLVVTAFSARPLTDTDFGWHLRSGLDLLRTLHIPKFDPYSYTMPDWHWVNHEWLSDGIVAFIYQHLGAAVLIFLFALLTVGAFTIAASWTEGVSTKSKLLITGLALYADITRWGVRMQMFTCLGVAAIFWSFVRYRAGRIKQLWWYIPLFWLWANLHGGFLIGLAILALLFTVEWIKYSARGRHPRQQPRSRVVEPTLEPHQLKHLVWVGLASGAVTLINPYGWRLYYDFYRLFSTPLVFKSINEWLPTSIHNSSNELFLIYLILLVIILIFTYRKFELTRWICALVLLFLAIFTSRNIPLFLLISIGLFAEVIDPWVRRLTLWLMRLRWLVTVFTIGIAAVWVLPNVVRFARSAGDITSISRGVYPLQAVQWAKAHPDQIGARMFNAYGDGGFLIWQFPEQKVFIDGRMSFWWIGDRFAHYDGLVACLGDPSAIKMIQDRYGVDWMMIERRFPLVQALQSQPDWQLVYSDSVAVIYTKKSVLKQ